MALRVRSGSEILMESMVELFRIEGPVMTHTQKEDRPLWLRVLQFPLVRLLLLGSLLFLLMGISNSLWGEAFADRPLIAAGIAALMALIGLGVYAGFVKLVEQRPVSELALPGMGRELGLGLLGGAGLYALCVLILMALGVYRIEGINPVALMLPSIAMAVSSGVFEELLHRGTIFRNVEDLLGSWIALLASALFFGFRHLGNADGNILGAIAITIEAGLLLAALYLLTRRLWLCIGFHMAWNFTQAGIFSGTVSGGFEQPGLFKAVIEGPELLTGGMFGMEASLVALVICTSLGLAVLAVAIRRGNLVQPSWMGKS
jgi:membrane protease YdiL (CAAX protease family)